MTVTNLDFKYLGKSFPRKGGVERVTGAGIYGVDLTLPGMVRGGVLRSEHAHAKIKSIDTREAEALPGVFAVVTAKDAPDVKYGRAVIDRPMLARDKVLYRGDPVAAVAADTEATIRKALKMIKVEYEPLPVVLDAEEAMKPEAPTLHEKVPPPANLPKDVQAKNLVAYIPVHCGDPDKAMEQADYVIEESYETQMVHPQYLEPRIAAARVENDGRLTIWVNAQAPFGVRSEVSKLLKIPVNNIRVLVTDIGGGFGGKATGIASSASLEPICALLALKSKKPVLMILDKAEETLATTVRGAVKVWIKTGVKKDGTIVARKGRMIFDTGAYSGFGAQAGGRCAQMLAGCYRVPNVHVDGYVVYTNKQVCGAVRGPGGIQAAFPVESHMDSIAEKLGIDPIEFRLKNVPEPGETIAGGLKLHDVSLGQTIVKAAEKIGWGKTKLKENQGIGFACSAWIESGAVGGGAIVKVNEDGSATLLIGKVDYGTAVRFGIPMIVAEELGIPFDEVTVLSVDTDTAPWDAGTVGSRTTLVSGEATRLAAVDARNQLFKIAARLLEANVEDLIAEERQIRVKGAPARGVPLSQVATAAHAELGEVIGRGYYEGKAIETEEKEKGSSPPFTTHAALVEVDPDTGHVQVLKYVAVHDVGIAIHPDGVEGQIEGAVVQGLGQALCEQVLFDDKGRTLNTTFVDYLMPTANITPEIEPVVVEGYLGTGPYGAKGIGEIPCVPVPAAIANAIHNAIGVRVRKLPLSPEKVLRALREQKGPR